MDWSTKAGVQVEGGRFVVRQHRRIRALSAGQQVGKFAIQRRIVGKDVKKRFKLLHRIEYRSGH
jgi:hypothetical protein